MYKYSKRTIIANFLFSFSLLTISFFLDVEIWYKIVVGLVGVMILRDAFGERNASFELLGDKLVVRNKEKLIREIKYRDMKYLTITRKNKKWIVIANDDKIIFTIKPKIERYTEMVAELIQLNKSNKKLEIHDYIKKTYKK